jgi:hypothetical protein
MKFEKRPESISVDAPLPASEERLAAFLAETIHCALRGVSFAKLWAVAQASGLPYQQVRLVQLDPSAVLPIAPPDLERWELLCGYAHKAHDFAPLELANARCAAWRCPALRYSLGTDAETSSLAAVARKVAQAWRDLIQGVRMRRLRLVWLLRSVLAKARKWAAFWFKPAAANHGNLSTHVQGAARRSAALHLKAVTPNEQACSAHAQGACQRSVASHHELSARVSAPGGFGRTSACTEDEGFCLNHCRAQGECCAQILAAAKALVETSQPVRAHRGPEGL